MQANRNRTTQAHRVDAGQARDRWTWVSMARSMTASSLERKRAGSHSGFYLALPHQQETPDA
jgi:hypothetical protein